MARPSSDKRTGRQQWKPILILAGLSIAILGEIALIAHYSSNETKGSRINLPKPDGGLPGAVSGGRILLESSDQRSADLDAASLNSKEKIDANLLNPLEQSFQDKKMDERAKAFGLN